MHYKLLFNKNGTPTYGSQYVYNPRTYDAPKGNYVILDYVSGPEGVSESDLLAHTKKGLETLPKDYSTNILLSYHPETKLETGLLKFYEWYKNQNPVSE